MNGKTLWFPGKTKKAVTLSYDDGVIQDRRLLEIMKKNGIKGTFNISSNWGGVGRRMTMEECIPLYRAYGQEIAYHGAEHKMYHTLETAQVILDVLNDRIALENLTGDFILGGAYPYGSFNKDIKDILRLSGIKYSRTASSNNGFEIPTDWLEWTPTCHHDNPALMELTERFLANKPWMAQILYVWGHAYEFDDKNNWEVIEKFCERIKGEPVWFATNGEIYEYVEAYRSLRFFADESVVYNPTQMDVWFADLRDEEPILVPAGKRVRVATGEII